MLSVLNLEKIIKSIDKTGNYLFVILISTACIHCVFLLLFLALQVYAMALINCVSVLVYMLVLRLAAQGRYDLSGPIAFVEILAHQLLGTYFCGQDAGFGYLLLCLLLAQFGMLHKRFCQLIATCLISLCVLGCYFLATYGSHIYSPLLFSNEHYANAHYILRPLNLTFSIAFLVIYGLIANVNRSGKIDDLLNLAYKDFLTGLYNRRYLEEHAWAQHKGAKSLLVAICDIDNFKQINDSFGHDNGDVVLKLSATFIHQICAKARKDAEFCACRWGGEEFVILASNLSEAEALELLNAIRLRIYNHEFLEINCAISITIGAVMFENPKHLSLAECVKLADEKLYLGKKSTKNIVVYEKFKNN